MNIYYHQKTLKMDKLIPIEKLIAAGKIVTYQGHLIYMERSGKIRCNGKLFDTPKEAIDHIDKLCVLCF